MDTKKNLKPELKEIYERVMNTQPTSRTSPTPPASAKPTTPVAQQPSTPVNTPPVSSTPEVQAPAEPFLSSSAPRAINNAGGFVFSSHGKTLPQQEKK